MNLNDWSPHLQKFVALEKHAHQELNSKKYRDAYEHLLEMEHHWSHGPRLDFERTVKGKE